MQSLLFSHTVHAIMGGAVVFLIGNLLLLKAAKIRARGQRPSRGHTITGNLLGLMGLVVLGVGVYAGVLGPVKVGRFVLRPFKFAPTSSASYRRSLNYVRNQLEVSSRPAVGWHGASSKALEYTVNNKGNR